MRIEIVEEPVSALAEYASVCVAFKVDRVLELTPLGGDPERFALAERPVERPYVKDYDALDGGGPARWAERFDLSSWRFFGAYADGKRVGGAAVALGTSELNDRRPDVAVLWDIRVDSQYRGQWIGTQLFRAVEACAKAAGCRQLMAETQNVNVPACRFYASHGCVLREAHHRTYPTLPEEVRLLWYKDL
ncbi:MAG TPA: GNAT family N-acetyltransferase [Tepidisphaeraceae bacterium]|nr:GNAT family N-acetyltransferase [Tepidisphaeraceae bacterium]